MISRRHLKDIHSVSRTIKRTAVLGPASAVGFAVLLLSPSASLLLSREFSSSSSPKVVSRQGSLLPQRTSSNWINLPSRFSQPDQMAPSRRRGGKVASVHQLKGADGAEEINNGSNQKRERSTAARTRGRPKRQEDATTAIHEETGAGSIPETAAKVKRTSAPKHQVLTERDAIDKLWDPTQTVSKGSHAFKIASWNVAGLRALLKKTPKVLEDLVRKHDLDVLCLQETKLQEQHLDDPKFRIRGLLDGYDDYWSCAIEKKGYAGTAVFVKQRQTSDRPMKKKQKTIGDFFAKADGRSASTAVLDENNFLVPLQVRYGMGTEKHDREGRVIVVDFPLFSICNVYVPNSGQALARLDYRIEEWDEDFVAFMKQVKAERGVPVIWLGDLNVAHTKLEVWNDGAKHLLTQAGVTPQERASFQKQLDSGFVDAFRRLHPEAKGHYTYWSTRAGNREPNKGLRLDYFICDPCLFEMKNSWNVYVRDSFMDWEQLGSDHCPIVLEMEITGNGDNYSEYQVR